MTVRPGVSNKVDHMLFSILQARLILTGFHKDVPILYTIELNPFTYWQMIYEMWQNQLNNGVPTRNSTTCMWY